MQYFKTAASRRKAEQNGLVVYASAAIIERKEPIIRIPLLATGYRLCVYASGSLITVILNCVILIRVTCLHFGQNRGKFFNSVSRTSKSYFPFVQSASASLSVLVIFNSNPCFLKAKESPLIRLRSSSKSNILLMLLPPMEILLQPRYNLYLGSNKEIILRFLHLYFLLWLLQYSPPHD